ncbi:DUF6880 family protein [Xenorhabdus lircayensis]|uniref:Uncharacterized protein n=1 Tax=Xenorhabdus lircayensis TaxID=2763499 RepID=A0ABS0U7Y2_9GAMM|nr:DUF6880 family protein [Xenorhabdus lircayensis]MBI6548856.1 hypothetical protein [Xenorhabdus lircayensis]
MEPKDILKLIEKEYKKRTKSQRFFDYYETDIFFEELYKAMTPLLDNAILQAPEESETLLAKMVLDFDRVAETKDTSSGGWQDYYFYLIETWIKAIALQKDIDRAVVANKLFNIAQRTYFCSNETFLLNYKNDFGLETFYLLRDLFYHHKKYREAIAISKALNDMDFLKMMIDQKLESSSIITAYLTYAELLIEGVRADEAIVILENFRKDYEIQKSKYYDVLMSLLIKANIDEGQKEKAKELCFEAFQNEYSYKFYELYENLIDESERSQAIQLFLGVTKKDGDFQYICFLVEMQKFDLLNEYILTLEEKNKERLIEICGHKLAMEGSAGLDKCGFAHSAIFLRRALVTDVLNRGESKYYKYSVSDLKKSLDYSQKISSWQELDTNETYLNSLYEKHKRKVSFWTLVEGKIKRISISKAGLNYSK